MSMTERFGQTIVKLELGWTARAGARMLNRRPRNRGKEANMIAEDIERPATENRGVDPVKRRQIADGASRVFLAQGFDAASMGAIAREAGVSKGTLYVYFKSKEELFEAIVEEQRRQQAE